MIDYCRSDMLKSRRKETVTSGTDGRESTRESCGGHNDRQKHIMGTGSEDSIQKEI